MRRATADFLRSRARHDRLLSDSSQPQPLQSDAASRPFCADDYTIRKRRWRGTGLIERFLLPVAARQHASATASAISISTAVRLPRSQVVAKKIYRTLVGPPTTESANGSNPESGE